MRGNRSRLDGVRGQTPHNGISDREDTSELARRAFHGGHGRLPHEDPETPHASDARRWVTIYAELVQFKTSLIERTQNSVTGLSEVAREEIDRTDIGALVEQRGRYEERLRFWHARHVQLQGLELDAETRVMRFHGQEVDLTRREVELLRLLLDSPDHYHSADEILNDAWGNGGLHGEQVRTYVARLRRKLDAVSAPYELVTRPRRGYALLNR